MIFQMSRRDYAGQFNFIIIYCRLWANTQLPLFYLPPFRTKRVTRFLFPLHNRPQFLPSTPILSFVTKTQNSLHGWSLVQTDQPCLHWAAVRQIMGAVLLRLFLIDLFLRGQQVNVNQCFSENRKRNRWRKRVVLWSSYIHTFFSTIEDRKTGKELKFIPIEIDSGLDHQRPTPTTANLGSVNYRPDRHLGGNKEKSTKCPLKYSTLLLSKTISIWIC